MPKKRLWIIVGGIVILVAVAAVAYLVGKHTSPPATDTNRFVRVVPPVERQRRTEETPPTQPPPYQYFQTTPPETLATLVGRCSACNGRGFFSDPTICPVCGGAGKVIGVRVVGYVGGIPVYQRDNAPTLCPYCRGYGFFLPSYGR